MTTTHQTHPPTQSLSSDALVEILTATTSVAHDPERFTDSELHALVRAWHQLLATTPELYVSVPAIFSFHQAVLSEHELRCWGDHGEGWNG